MSEYLSGPVILVALGAVSAAAVASIVTTIVIHQRRERERQERARQERERDRRQREAEERDRIVAERRRSRPFADLRPRAKRQPSVPAPGRTGFRTDRDPIYNDTTSALMATGILYDHQPYDSGSRSDPSPSSSYDSGSSSSSSDSGSSFSGSGDSGSF